MKKQTSLPTLYMRRWRKKQGTTYKTYQKQYHAKYYQNIENKKTARRRAAKWYKDNKEKATLYKREWYLKTRKLIGRKEGQKHHNWKGDKATLSAIHKWVERKLGKPKKCAHCKIGGKVRFSWANKDHQYKRNTDDWMRLCPKCHQKWDLENNAFALFGREPQ